MKNLKDLPVDLQPDEKCKNYGCESLSNEELLAVIIRSGTMKKNSVEVSREVLELSSQSLLGLCSLSIDELMTIDGIGEVKALQLKCVAELSKRISTMQYRKDITMNSPDSIAAYYREQLRHDHREHVILSCFDAKNHLLKDCILSIGTATGSYTTAREIYRKALEYHAIYIVLLHNHPSGDPRPSAQDIAFSREIKELGEMLGVPLVDHIIIGDCGYVSLREEQLI